MDRRIWRASPGRERNWFATAAKDCEGENKNQHLCATIHSSGDKIVPFDKELRVALAQVELRKEGDNEEGRYTRIDANEQVTAIPQYDRGVEICKNLPACVPVRKPKRKRSHESEQEGQGDPLIPRSNGEHLFGNRPSNGKSVELLNVLTGPDVGALDGQKNWSLILDNGYHHKPIEDSTDHATSNLNKECTPWWQMRILSQLEIAGKQLTLLQ